MEYVPVFLIMFVFTTIISWLWVMAIDNMKKNHPDYNGEDFLNWDEKHPWNKNEQKKEDK